MCLYRRLAGAVLAFALGTSPSAQQTPDQVQSDVPRFRGGVELVQLDVSVLDGDRRPITGLTASDFTVLENGRERPIRAFTLVLLPSRTSVTPVNSATIGSRLAPDVTTNQVANQEGRLVFILMDRTIPLGQPTLAARKIATAAVEALGPGDLAALVSTSGGVPQTLTADRSRLIAAIGQRDWSTDMSKEQLEVFGDPLVDGRCLCGLCVLNRLTNIADAVRNVPRRRKMVLFIGNSISFQAGLEHVPWRDVGCVRVTRDAQERLFQALALSHLTVHSIDPAGVVNIGPQTRAGAGGGKQVPDPQALRRRMFQTETTEHITNQGSLRVLPDLTGGRAVMNTNGPEQDVPAIFDETGSYYVLAFEPAAPARENEHRSIEVKVRRDGVRVHAQRQYTVQPAAIATAPAAQASRSPVPLQQALQGLLPNASRPLTMALAAFAGIGTSKALVTVNVDVGAFAVPDGTPVPLDFAVAALDGFGRHVMSARQTSTITFQPGSSSQPVEANVQTQLELDPGAYEVRLAVSDPARKATASVYSEITVPSFGSDALTLSDVTFETTGRSAPNAMPPGPTTRRVFPRDERVRAILQVYQSTQRTGPLLPAAVRVRMVDATGRTVRDRVIRLTEKEFTERRASVAADIDGLPTGDYVLTFDTSMAAQTLSRAVRFAVK